MENNVELKVSRNGRIVIRTKLKEIPIAVAQKLLDESIAAVVQKQIPEVSKRLILNNYLEAKMWKTIAFAQLIIALILIIIF